MQNVSMGKIIGSVVGLAVVVVLGLSVLFGSWFTVDAGDRAVLIRNGSPVGVYDQGLHFKFPWIDSTTEFSIRTQKIEWDSDGKSDNRMIGYSKDLQPVTFGLAVNYHLNPEKVKDIYVNQGINYQARLLDNNIRNQAKDVIGKFTAGEIVSSRDQVAIQIKTELDKVLLPYGVNVEQVQLTSTAFSKDFETSVEQRMQAQIAVQRKEQELQAAEVDAKTARAKAEGEAAAVKAAADGDAYSVKVAADAAAYSTQVDAKATSEAMRIKMQAIGSAKDYIEWIKANKWAGNVPSTMLPGAAVPMISLPNEK